MKKQKHSNLKFLAESKTELFFSYLIQFFFPERSWKLEFPSPSFQGFINTLDFAVLKSWGKIYWLALVEEFHPCIRLLQWNTWTAPLPPKKSSKKWFTLAYGLNTHFPMKVKLVGATGLLITVQQQSESQRSRQYGQTKLSWSAYNDS